MNDYKKGKKRNSPLKDDFFSEIGYNEIVIKTEFIALDQFLKYSGVAPTGGIAKMMIKDGLIYLNNEICLLKKKKLFKEDRVVSLENKENPVGYILI